MDGFKFAFDGPPSPTPLATPKRQFLWQLAPDPKSLTGVKNAIKTPADVAFIAENFFITADSDGHRLLIFDHTGRLVTTICDGQVWPNSITVTRDDKIVLTDRKKKLIKIYDISGECIRAFGDEYSVIDEIEYRPHGVAVNSKGQIIVTDTSLNCCCIYSPERKLLSQFGDKGDRVNQLHLPFYCTVDLHDNIIISDNMNYCVKKFDQFGNFLLKIGSGQDWGQRQFLCPYGVCVDPENNILIADSQGSKVSMFSSKGEPMGDLVKKMDGCQSPCGVAVNSVGELVFSESTLDYSNVKMYQIMYASSCV